ncbi:unnamed protein product [Caenorhabditis auriculariae]|uniref:Uncharacterized protein n=1 Tax=Caenorhabditis auriculariae TaxID=2777116 RepID=A0A8S1H0N2_9PELO|nr:unnamed protein product [Caenorhabditis auriculariae]
MNDRRSSTPFTEDCMNIGDSESNPPIQPEVQSDEDERHEKMDCVPGLDERIPRAQKKTVSINSPVKINSILLRSRMNRTPSGSVRDENTPLLPQCSSLPTVVGLDEVVDDYPGPSGTTRSEIGRSELIRKRRSRRARHNTEIFLRIRGKTR